MEASEYDEDDSEDDDNDQDEEVDSELVEGDIATGGGGSGGGDLDSERIVVTAAIIACCPCSSVTIRPIRLLLCSFVCRSRLFVAASACEAVGWNIDEVLDDDPGSSPIRVIGMMSFCHYRFD